MDPPILERLRSPRRADQKNPAGERCHPAVIPERLPPSGPPRIPRRRAEPTGHNRRQTARKGSAPKVLGRSSVTNYDTNKSAASPRIAEGSNGRPYALPQLRARSTKDNPRRPSAGRSRRLQTIEAKSFRRNRPTPARPRAAPSKKRPPAVPRRIAVQYGRSNPRYRRFTGFRGQILFSTRASRIRAAGVGSDTGHETDCGIPRSSSKQPPAAACGGWQAARKRSRPPRITASGFSRST